MCTVECIVEQPDQHCNGSQQRIHADGDLGRCGLPAAVVCTPRESKSSLGCIQCRAQLHATPHRIVPLAGPDIGCESKTFAQRYKHRSHRLGCTAGACEEHAGSASACTSQKVARIAHQRRSLLLLAALPVAVMCIGFRMEAQERRNHSCRDPQGIERRTASRA